MLITRIPNYDISACINSTLQRRKKFCSLFVSSVKDGLFLREVGMLLYDKISSKILRNT